MTGFRTTSGGLVDRGRTVPFMFDGRRFHGHEGDTLAAALMANGVMLFGRSFKYHRPRGILAAGVEEPNALVTVTTDGAREPNVRATELEIYPGLVCESQNRWPSLDMDVGAVNGLAGPAIAAGFYYKTFMGPVVGPLKGTRFWMFCEALIRRAAGLGSAGTTPDPDRYEKMNAFCDVLVVGTGPAGLAAAKAAAASGKRVILAEQSHRLGGSLNWSDARVDGRPAASYAADEVAALRAMDTVRLLPRTTVWGWYDSNTLGALERVADHKAGRRPGEPRQRYWVIRAREVILATGAFERPIVFPGNDRPGVMLADSAVRYAAEYGVLPGRRIAVFANNDTGYTAARQLQSASAEIVCVVDPRPEPSPEARAIAQAAGLRVFAGHAVISTKGAKAVREITIQPFLATIGEVTGATRSFVCDCLVMSGGWSPVLHLASQAGHQPVWDDRLKAFLPPAAARGGKAAGSAAGRFGLVEAMASGAEAGGGAPDAAPAIATDAINPAPAAVFEIRAGAKAFVDFQHDVTADDIRLAHREGFRSVEHLKRYTTLGMATDQGKTSNLPGLAIMAEARGMAIPEAGTTRFRPPFTPVAMGAIAADQYGEVRPDRYTPMHDWHVERGARMYEAGLWHRPMIFGLPGETVEQAYVREAKAVREAVGISDVSTLGKIEVQGPDAAEFLDRVYTNMFSTLPVGRARYGLMLREDGFAMDDGTTWRLAEDRFLMTTTTANAGKVMQHLEWFLDTVWPDLRVHVTSVTDEWAGAAVAGPRSRAVLAACVTGTAVDDPALPFMGIVTGHIAGVPVTICRLSFSGERAYEVYCGADHGLTVWEALMEAGEPFGIVPYGLEALGTLRIEKGHVTGAEIDGRTTARDLHLDWMLSKKKPFVGSMMMDREGMVGPHRQTLVGIVSRDGRPLRGGAHLVEAPEPTSPAKSLGHVTATCFSPALGKYVGLALLENGATRLGAQLWATDPVRSGDHLPVEIVSHHMVDKDNARLHLDWTPEDGEADAPAAVRPMADGDDAAPPRVSPLAGHYPLGRHGDLTHGAGVTVSDIRPGSIVEVAAFAGFEARAREAIASATGLILGESANAGTASETHSAFCIGPGRWLLSSVEAGLAGTVRDAIGANGSAFDLTHGRVAIRVSGPKAEWVLAKLYAIDFALPAFPPGAGLATTHHDIFTQIQRRDETGFDLYVYRSFARSFWTLLRHSAEEVGYEVA